MTSKFSSRRLALIPSQTIDTVAKIAQCRHASWREMMRRAATAVVNDDNCVEMVMETLGMIQNQKEYSEKLDGLAERMRLFAIDVWPELDLNVQLFIADLYWVFKNELPD